MGAGAGSSRRLLTLLVALPCLAALSAAQVLEVSERPISDVGFPYIKCTDYGCSSAPYTLDLVETALAHQATTKMCFRVSPRPGGCGPEPSACCQALEQRLGKIDLSVGECRARVWMGGVGWVGEGGLLASRPAGPAWPAPGS
jgi:hypothetical protein